MQTPKSRNSSSGAPQKNSPRSVSSEAAQKSSPQANSSEPPQKVSPRVARQLKTGPRYFEHTASSINLATKPPKERSPKVSDHLSPKTPAAETKRSARVSELESQVSQLENDLNLVKVQLSSTESSKKLAEKDAEEAKNQILALTLKLEELQNKPLDNIGLNEVLPDTSQEPNQALKSELEAVKEQSSNDSAALVSALEEIEQLKLKLEMAAESEADHSKTSESAQAELSRLKEKLSETLLVVEEMRKELKESKESEAKAHEMIEGTLMQLENANKWMEKLRSDGAKEREGYSAIASELEESRARVNYLEDLVSELKVQISVKSDNEGICNTEIESNEEEQTMESAEIEISSVKLEIKQLRSALEAAEIRYNEEQARCTQQIQNALETVEKVKSESYERETKLEDELHESKYKIEELKAKLMDKETELQGICEENDILNKKLEDTLSNHREEELEHELSKSKADLENIKALLTDKENEWQNIIDENENLKSQIKETSSMINQEKGEIVSDIESIRASEREALMKVGYMMEEVEKSNRKVARITEQLEAAK